jgi:hypothetical protein
LPSGLASHIIHTKKSLYYDLIKIEERNYKKKWKDTIQTKPDFNISYNDFKKLNRKEIIARYAYDDTSKYIIDYYMHMLFLKNSGLGLILIMPIEIITGAILAYPYSGENLLLGAFFATYGIMSGSVGIPIYLATSSIASKDILHQRLLTYYSSGKIDKRVQKYIMKKQR